MLTANGQTAALFGVQGVPPEELEDFVLEMYDVTINMIPSVLLISSFVTSYVEYVLFERAVDKSIATVSRLEPERVRDGKLLLRDDPPEYAQNMRKMPKFSEFRLPFNFMILCVAILIITWILASSPTLKAGLVMNNVEAVISFMFVVQGASVFFRLGELRKVSPALVTILCVAVVCFTIGRTLLFIVGVFDFVFDIKGRKLK
jgi:uncharacterized protein YybS (DUF2232 family)